MRGEEEKKQQLKSTRVKLIGKCGDTQDWGKHKTKPSMFEPYAADFGKTHILSSGTLGTPCLIVAFDITVRKKK